MQKHKLWLSLLGCVYAIAILGLIVFQQYFSADALYARDNINFIRQQWEIPEEKNILPASRNVNLAQINAYATVKTVIYIQQYIENVNDTEVINTLPEEPYNTLSRLWLLANDESIQTIYDSLQFCAAITNPEHPDTLLTVIQTNGQSDIVTQLTVSTNTLSDLVFQTKILVSIHLALFIICVQQFGTTLYRVHKNTAGG